MAKIYGNTVATTIIPSGGGGGSSDHTHTNKDVLDKITQEKIDKWDSKLEAKIKYYGRADIEITPTYQLDETIPDDVLMCLFKGRISFTNNVMKQCIGIRQQETVLFLI